MSDAPCTKLLTESLGCAAISHPGEEDRFPSKKTAIPSERMFRIGGWAGGTLGLREKKICFFFFVFCFANGTRPWYRSLRSAQFFGSWEHYPAISSVRNGVEKIGRWIDPRPQSRFFYTHGPSFPLDFCRFKTCKAWPWEVLAKVPQVYDIPKRGESFDVGPPPFGSPPPPPPPPEIHDPGRLPDHLTLFSIDVWTRAVAFRGSASTLATGSCGALRSHIFDFRLCHVPGFRPLISGRHEQLH